MMSEHRKEREQLAIQAAWMDKQISAFTKKERRVLALLAQGQGNKLIAINMGLRESTVKFYLTKIMRKLGCANRVQVALYSFCVFNDLSMDLKMKVSLPKARPDTTNFKG